MPPTPEKKEENLEIVRLKRKLVEVTANLNMEKLQNKRLKKLYSRDEPHSESESDNDEPKTLDQAKQRLLEQMSVGVNTHLLKPIHCAG